MDNGLFLPLALRLSKDFKRVLYHTPHERAFPVINDSILGDGFEEIERCDDIFEVIKEVDLVVFPDVGGSGLQKHLESMGKRVWGSRQGDDLELKRILLKKTQEEVNLNVPRYKSIRGLTALRAFLKENEHVFVKVSRFRGTTETFESIDYDHSLPLLDQLAVLLGPLQDQFPFMVEWPVDTNLEVGYDGYCIDGKYPKLGLQGWEAKDQGLIAAVQNYEDLPEQVTEVNDAFASVLADYKYRNFLSTEIRIDDGQGFLIDITCRGGVPSIESQIALWGNLADIIWHGSVGELVDPEPTAKYAVEAMVLHKDEKELWRILEVPDEAKDAIMPYAACFHDGLYCFPPFAHSSETVASIVTVNDDLAKAIERLKELAETLSDQPVKVSTNAIFEMLKSIQEAEKEGVEFTGDKLPEPESALT